MPNGESTATVVEQVPTRADLERAMAGGDINEVLKIAAAIKKGEAAAEKAELDAKVAALGAMAEKVKAAILKAVKPLVDSRELDAADGVWFSYDFGEQAPVLRLTKTAPRKSSSGGGTGKKFDISTDDMLARHGQAEFKNGISISQAYESNTDKNWRYGIRQKLLKLEGII